MIKISLQKLGKASSLRFRRWSRKAYAVFVSRHNEVTIGQLSGNVCERLRCKIENSFNSDVRISSEKESFDYEDLSDESLAIEVGVSLFALQCSVKTAPSNGILSYSRSFFLEFSYIDYLYIRAWCRETLSLFLFNYTSKMNDRKAIK